MLKLKKYAAVDIGSNAIRLLIETVIEKDDEAARYKKTSLVRVPIRLGTDVFTNKNISKHNYSRMVDTLNAYQLLMKTHNVVQYRACATSAMREAENGMEIAKKLYKDTGIKIEIIGYSEFDGNLSIQNLDKNESNVLGPRITEQIFVQVF